MSANSIANWVDLEKKFHSYFYAGVGEKNIADLADLRQRTNESGVDFLRSFRETRNLCFLMNLLDDPWTALPVIGMLPTLREKLVGHEFDNLSQLAQKVSTLNSQFQSVRRENRF